MQKTVEITRLIHENLWIVISFAFARPVVDKVVAQSFAGEWKYLEKTIGEFSERRADRALLEMAIELRALDDQDKLDEFFKKQARWPLGTVTQGDGTTTDLHFRDMTNKVMHATSFEWDLSNPMDPKVICFPHDEGRWKRAAINLIAVMALVGRLIF
jgi:hypothetical protein